MAKGSRGGVAFLVTFLVFLVLFGGIMALGVRDYWQQGREDTSPTTAPTATPASTPHRLLVITEEAGEAQGFVVLTADVSAARITAVPFPRETAVTRQTEQIRLFELYRSASPQEVTQAVSALFGQEIPRYAVLTYANLQKLVTDYGEGLLFMLNEPVSWLNEAGATVKLSSGAHTISAAQVAEVLRYDGWSSGARGRANAQGQVAAALVNQYLTPSRMQAADTEFARLVNYTRSDLLVSDLETVRADLTWLAARNDATLCRVESPAGQFVGVGENLRFEPAE